MSKEYQVIHKKSNVLTNGQPKLPSASTIEYGEIAINYAKGGETMSIKNANNEIVTFSSDAKILGQMPAVADYFDGAEYDSNSKRINFKHGNTVKAYIDATNFIKDGMVDDVEITAPTGGTYLGVTCLVVTFNTDAGKEDIEIPISLIFDPSNYYDKDDADEKFLTVSSYTEDEEVVAAALNDLNDRIEAIDVPRYTSSLINDMGFITSAYTGFASSSHTHSQYATTAHTHTAAEVGAMATSERSNYSTTGHTHTAAEVGAMATSERSNYSTTGHTHSQYATTAHTHTAAEVGAMATSERSNYATTAHTHTAAEVGAMATSERSNYSTTGHTHSEYSTTAHTHTAAEVGAMATSERSNYLATGTTLDNIADGTTRKLSNYSTTGHSHTAAEVGAMATSERSNYATTAHTHTAAEVGAMATSERSNYATTAHTHTAAEVGAMATSERSNYATTAHTHTAAEVGAMATSERSNYSTTGHTHSQYATTSHTHTAAEVGAMATSERGNYLTTATTIPTESTIVGSGFTKNAIIGINVNGSAATVTNGVAEITVQSGGSTLPSVTAADNGKVLMVVNGAWAAVMPTTVYTGTDAPLSSIGNDGDIYLQTS